VMNMRHRRGSTWPAATAVAVCAVSPGMAVRPLLPVIDGEVIFTFGHDGGIAAGLGLPPVVYAWSRLSRVHPDVVEVRS
jgi:hypothetical protein